MDDSDSEGEGWLFRLGADEWLRAAQGELGRATAALRNKQQRAGVTQARRAAGMAWNAVLRGIAARDERARYGRSYMDHLRVLAAEETVAMNVREAAQQLVFAPLEQQLVQLGEGSTMLARAAEAVIDEARRRVDGSTRS